MLELVGNTTVFVSFFFFSLVVLVRDKEPFCQTENLLLPKKN